MGKIIRLQPWLVVVALSACVLIGQTGCRCLGRWIPFHEHCHEHGQPDEQPKAAVLKAPAVVVRTKNVVVRVAKVTGLLVLGAVFWGFESWLDDWGDDDGLVKMNTGGMTRTIRSPPVEGENLRTGMLAWHAAPGHNAVALPPCYPARLLATHWKLPPCVPGTSCR